MLETSILPSNIWTDENTDWSYQTRFILQTTTKHYSAELACNVVFFCCNLGCLVSIHILGKKMVNNFTLNSNCGEAF